jgi:hypothetical protein
LNWPFVSHKKYLELQRKHIELQLELSDAKKRIAELENPPKDAKGNPVMTQLPPRLTRWQATKRRVEAQLRPDKPPKTAQEVLKETANVQ